jgi:hypothetical protein
MEGGEGTKAKLLSLLKEMEVYRVKKEISEFTSEAMSS